MHWFSFYSLQLHRKTQDVLSCAVVGSSVQLLSCIDVQKQTFITILLHCWNCCIVQFCKNELLSQYYYITGSAVLCSCGKMNFYYELWRVLLHYWGCCVLQQWKKTFIMNYGEYYYITGTAVLCSSGNIYH